VCVCVCVGESARPGRACGGTGGMDRQSTALTSGVQPAACTASQQPPSHLSLTSMQSAGLLALYLTTAGASAYCWQPDGKSVEARVVQNDIL
jgi:hypothetical protein